MESVTGVRRYPSVKKGLPAVQEGQTSRLKMNLERRRTRAAVTSAWRDSALAEVRLNRAA